MTLERTVWFVRRDSADSRVKAICWEGRSLLLAMYAMMALAPSAPALVWYLTASPSLAILSFVLPFALLFLIGFVVNQHFDATKTLAEHMKAEGPR